MKDARHRHDQSGNVWHVVCIPAEAERADDVLGRAIGERIWPEHFAADHFAPHKVHSRAWAALYQQRPAPEEGDYFKADWLRVVERLPPNLRTWGASDYAVSSGRGDTTVHVVVGLDPEKRMYLLDVWRRQSASNEWIEAFCDLVETSFAEVYLRTTLTFPHHVSERPGSSSGRPKSRAPAT